MKLKSKVIRSRLTSRIVKLGAKLTPKIFVRAVANYILKGIASFSSISFDLDSRTAFMKVTLHGEEEPIEIAIDGYEIIGDEQQYKFMLHHAESNKPWLTNLFARFTGRALNIPDVPKFQDELKFAANLLEPKKGLAGRELVRSEPKTGKGLKSR